MDCVQQASNPKKVKANNNQTTFYPMITAEKVVLNGRP